ncbi:Stk1 family PASTA domain-containing Ser/Thr kinase [Rhodococcus sp. HNM0569]|uniref:Stk1 family PASTA domain-containing Ser/Thr kinase n=1 Tax=Rhodococcus sp. HNM0569 TaxID=2716340 RepID=UPI00146A57C8|nr:Stk1 family PASTA domain-containing Ser/Thr kinase [Rhodococcus sp. HNM0569]NLU82900.1 Stk1 family PASTA domain-containing Ser/Thr kinase [Rhodococcus sp. HNM0569]
MIGQLLDRRYRVDSPIARGGMSTVYRGLDLRLDRPVAIKVMDPQFASDPAFVSRFEFEARAVARLKHPSLVAVYDQGHDQGHAFLVMELVEGGTLRELLRERGPMPPHAVAAVAGPVLSALAVAHRAGLVHRDVKPENVLISDTGEVKIADFGLVRAAAASTTTSNSVILGTAAYLSPEQVTSGIADTRSDVYSMGILMFELLTGHPPFTGDTSLSVAYQRVNQDVPRPGSYIVGVPPQFDDLVAEATHREPAHRFRDAGAMADALQSVADELDLPDYRVPAPRRSAEHLSHAVPRDATAADSAAPTAHVARQQPPTSDLHTPTQHTPVQHTPVQHTPLQHTKVVTGVTPRPDAPVDAAEQPATFADAGTRVRPRGDYPFPDFAAERQRSRRSLAVWLLAILVLAVALAAGGWWLGSGRYTAVPPLDGLDRGAAVEAVEAAGLSYVVRGEYSDSAEPDVLLGTDPESGGRVERSGTVALRVSLGKPTVPTLPAGGDRTASESALRERTFVPVEGGEAFSSTIPVGAVAAFEPASGVALPVGSQVRLIYSKGAAPVEIPDVSGMPEGKARAALEDAGLVVGDVESRFDAKIEGGHAVGTSPKTGRTVDSGSTVTLTVSDAVSVPSMLGRTVGSARDELTRLGLDVEVRRLASSDKSLVIRQTPGSGDLVRPGSTVTLTSLP